MPPMTRRPTFLPPGQTTQPVRPGSISVTPAPETTLPNAPDPRIRQLQTSLAATQPFQPPAADPQLDALRARLTGSGGAGAPVDDSRLQALIARLESGQFNVGDVSTDPEARARRVATARQLEQARESAAARQGASGFGTGGGEFDARVAQLQEAAGEQTSAFEADLAGRRRTEAIAGTQSAAALEAQRIEQAMRQAQSGQAADLALLQTLMSQSSEGARLALQNRSLEQQGQQSALESILAEQARQEAAAERGTVRASDEDLREREFGLRATRGGLEAELLRQQVREGRRTRGRGIRLPQGF